MSKSGVSSNKKAKELASFLLSNCVVNDSSSIFNRVSKEILLEPDSCEAEIFCGFADNTVDEMDDDGPAACASENETHNVAIAA